MEIAAQEPVVEESPEPPVRPRLRDRLGKARALLAGYFGDLRSRTTIDDEVWEELEEALIRADVGVVATERILDDLRRRMKETPVSTPSELLDLLKADLIDALHSADRSLAFSPGPAQRVDVRRRERGREDHQHRQDRPTGGGLGAAAS